MFFLIHSANFYFYDACMLASIIVGLFLKVNFGKEDKSSDSNSEKSTKEKKKEHRKAIKNLFTPSALLFFALLFGNGIAWGVKGKHLVYYMIHKFSNVLKLKWLAHLYFDSTWIQ